MKDKPEELSNLLNNSKLITCPNTQVFKVWVPKYSLACTTENSKTEERGRKIGTEENIKPVNQRKPRAIAATGKSATDTAEGAGDKEVPLAEPAVNKLESVAPNLEDAKLALSTQICAAKSPDLEGVLGVARFDKTGEAI